MIIFWSQNLNYNFGTTYYFTFTKRAKQLMNNNCSQKKSQQECTFIFELFLRDKG
jgi:hypothetical protein